VQFILEITKKKVMKQNHNC